MHIKGIVLAGGAGSRLYPLTKVTNKHLLPVGTKPMIFHPIEQLISAGITEIMVITGVEHMGHIMRLLGSGRDFNCDFTYRVQDEAGGIAQALGLAKKFVGKNSVAVILGDNVFEKSLSPSVKKFSKQGRGARVLVKKVLDASRFGVAQIKSNRIVHIDEKPKKPKSPFAVTGFYLYDSRVFNIIETLKPSSRGELEITDVNNYYATKGQLYYDVVEGWWSDAGTFESLLRANQLVGVKTKRVKK